MTAITIIGMAVTVWGIVTAFATLLQTKKILVTHSSESVSLGVWDAKAINAAICALFGIVTGNLFLVIPNVVTLATTLSTIIAAIHFH